MRKNHNGLEGCRSPNMRPRKLLMVPEWPVRKHKRARKGYEYYYRRARRNNAEMRRDGWRSREEMDNA